MAEPATSDNRFKNELWQNNFVFDYIKQSYLIAAQNMQKLVADAQGLDPQTARKVRFFTRQFVDALAPTNFAFTNPEVLNATMRNRRQESGGRTAESARGPRARRRPARHQHDRLQGVQARRERRHRARARSCIRTI